jgi:hypothetical protein
MIDSTSQRETLQKLISILAGIPLTSKLNGALSFSHVVGSEAGVVGEVLDADAFNDQLVLVRMVRRRMDLPISRMLLEQERVLVPSHDGVGIGKDVAYLEFVS